MRDKILSLVKEKGDLPPLPDILLRLEKLINDPESDIEAIAALIETEPVLSGRLIKMANSVLFGGGREQAKDLSTTILRLGIKMVLDLAYTLQLPSMFKKPKAFNQIRFWKHSLAVACLSQCLAENTGLSGEELEESYVCGLMHDLGILVFDFLITEEYSKFAKDLDKDSSLLEIQEIETFGIGHAELGARFIHHQWPVSPVVVRAVKEHHLPLKNDGSRLTIQKVVNIANQIANVNGIDHGLVPIIEVDLDPVVYEVLQVSPEELDAIVARPLENLRQTESSMKA